jgi:hypothetical protein
VPGLRRLLTACRTGWRSGLLGGRFTVFMVNRGCGQ